MFFYIASPLLFAVFSVFLGCTSPLQEALQQFESTPTTALEQISLLEESDREIAVMTVMRSKPDPKYCTLLSNGAVQERCLRMSRYAQKTSAKTSAIEYPPIEQISTSACSLHKDADTCWDLQIIQNIKEGNYDSILDMCSQLSHSYWQGECREHKALLIAQQGNFSKGFEMCHQTTHAQQCEQNALLGLAEHTISRIKQQKNPNKAQIQNNRDFISTRRKEIIAQLITTKQDEAYVYGETYLFYVTQMIFDDHIDDNESLPIESILIKNCNQALHVLRYNNWDLENLEEWQQHYMSILSQPQRKRTPRNFIESDIPVPTEGNRVAFAPFVLRSAIPQNPLADWTLCLLEGVARLENKDTRLLMEAKSYPHPIIQKRANELLSFLTPTSDKEQ